ncbi:MAG: hypothetical protein ACOVSW_16090 [Candidatus Kapaibacteriota bacterium]
MGYFPYSRVYYERLPLPISVNISGPTDLYSGQTGSYTANVTNNNGPINYTWQITENYTSGQSSGWLPFNSGGNSPFRSLYMLGSFSNVVLRVTATDNTSNAVATMYVLNSSGNPLRVASPVNFNAAPNPFSSSTVIGYVLGKDADVQLEIFSADRRRMAVLVNGKLKAGQQDHRLNADSWASGTYFAELTITDEANKPQRFSLTLNLAR